MDSYLVYDVEVLRGPDETKGGWRNPAGMGFGTAVVYESFLNRYLFYGLGDLTLENLQNLLTTKDYKLVGFNSVLFDNRVIFGNDFSFAPEVGYESEREVDLMLRIFKSKFGVETLDEAQDTYGMKTVHDGSCGLDAICKATLGRGKTGHGAFAPEQIKNQDYSGVFAYNLEDVRLTRDLYLFGLKYGYVIDGHDRKIPVNFR